MMNNAILKDNIPYCKCGSLLGNTKDYREVMVNGKCYTEFVRYCSQRGCMEISKYLLVLDLDQNIRSVTNDKVEAFKEEVKNIEEEL